MRHIYAIALYLLQYLPHNQQTRSFGTINRVQRVAWVKYIGCNGVVARGYLAPLTSGIPAALVIVGKLGDISAGHKSIQGDARSAQHQCVLRVGNFEMLSRNYKALPKANVGGTQSHASCHAPPMRRLLCSS